MKNTDKSNFKVQQTPKLHLTYHITNDQNNQMVNINHKLNMIKFVLSSTGPWGVYICKRVHRNPKKD